LGHFENWQRDPSFASFSEIINQIDKCRRKRYIPFSHSRKIETYGAEMNTMTIEQIAQPGAVSQSLP